MARLVNTRAQITPVITVIGEGLTEQYYFSLNSWTNLYKAFEAFENKT